MAGKSKIQAQSSSQQMAPTSTSSNVQAETSQPGLMPSLFRKANPVHRKSETSLQRKTCACGGTIEADGECASCRARRMKVQRKMTVNTPGDAQEQEADTIARSVVQRMAHSVTQRRPASHVQRQPMSESAPEVSSETEAQIEGARGGGQPLPNSIQRDMEDSFDANFSDVRVHHDAGADQLNRQMDARAFTTGSDIFFKQGEYNPQSSDGQELLAHELTHVVQQTQPVGPTAESQQANASSVQRLASNDNSGMAADANTPVFEAYKGKDVQKIGHVSAPKDQYHIAKTQGVNIRAKPDGMLTPIGRIVYDTRVQVRALDNTSAFYFVVARTGERGWINKDYVILNPPDLRSHLHHITEPDLTTILKNEYIVTGKWQLSTGNDYTTLAAAVVVANKGLIGVDVDREIAQKYKEDNTFKSMFDPWMIDNFAVYHGLTIKEGHNIWLPSTMYVRMLQSSGVIGSRPGWVNTAIDIGKGIAGFFAGLVSGVFGSIWDTFTGLWDLAKGIVDAVKSALDGSLFSAAQEIYDAVTSMTWKDFKNLVGEIITMGKDALVNFKDKWCHSDMYKKWHFRGSVIGAIALEVVLAIFTGGSTLGAKVLAKIGKYFPKLKTVLSVLLSKADDLNARRLSKDKRGRDRDGDRERSEDAENMNMADREWEQTRVMASLFTDAHDQKDTPVNMVISLLKLTFAAKSSVVKSYRAIPKGPGTFRIIQLARDNNEVDDRYSGPVDDTDMDESNLPEGTHRVFEPSTERSEASDWGERWMQTPSERRGEWIGDETRGEGKFVPHDPYIANLLEQRGLDGIEYKNGYPDFSRLAEDTIVLKIDLTDVRKDNYARIHEAFAEKWNREGKKGKPWTPTKVKKELAHKGWSPHEVEDSKTVQLIDSKLHGFFQHMGAVAEQRRLRGR